MNNFNQYLKNMCIKKNNRLCIGLDVDNEKLSNNSLSYMKGFIIDVINRNFHYFENGYHVSYT